MKQNKKRLLIILFILLIISAVAIVLVIQEQKMDEFGKKYEEAREYTSKIKYGLRESKRKEIFKALVKLQDMYTNLYPDDQNKQAEAYSMIATRYNCEEEIVQKIAVEGAEKGWVYEVK